MTLFVTIKFNNNFKMISFSRALMLFVFIGIVCTFLTSCTDPKSINISDDDASEYIEELATELDSVTFQKLNSKTLKKFANSKTTLLKKTHFWNEK